jgi:hypothetical protein
VVSCRPWHLDDIRLRLRALAGLPGDPDPAVVHSLPLEPSGDQVIRYRATSTGHVLRQQTWGSADQRSVTTRTAAGVGRPADDRCR